MGDSVWSDRLFGDPDRHTRQIKLQVAGQYDPYALAEWVVAGVATAPDATPHVTYLSHLVARERVRINLDPIKHDLAPHASFCRGELPPPVYADWLEENGIDLPEQAFRLLRWQYQ